MASQWGSMQRPQFQIRSPLRLLEVTTAGFDFWEMQLSQNNCLHSYLSLFS